MENQPILTSEGTGEEFGKGSGLDFGTDEGMTKPFSVCELPALDKALQRRG
jgi:DNA-binding response OmpR family regulator